MVETAEPEVIEETAAPVETAEPEVIEEAAAPAESEEIPKPTEIQQTYSEQAAKIKPITFDEEEELQYAQRVKRELEEARKNSILGNPRIKLPPIEEEPESVPEKSKKKRKKRELTEEEIEQKLRAKETPEETKARHRAALLDDLPDLPEEREMRRREKETPEQTKARRRAALLDDLPDVDDMQRERRAYPANDEPDIPKIDADAEAAAVSIDESGADPFADIHWNNEQTTFTIRL